ncbi:hypothetical protein COCC4DRAFT_66619 [Bipolaris maydis ATCC 48331]|uniref:Uncharacterized protein n=2 Tax=Cochliobolus heterostrophus TaxID=5016 RepID=M2TF59_COCH5|nr:uncharacterized protein COCC4DRAFT_66619 [Bipolaris maydis ATCC 48331]EMD85139.1 hypothetical protein COCHEDRAFT_1219658 [Bipolaris maydis C5]KAH7559911.1 hypothetical protein BM1_03545 [Bipolaris maydis]ENH99198.1 hypothetical protein COCC4DRAFT_66619 [Bipolaris maydis ATCC 48331]KAJ5022468.1 hypothetical protein J3E73DRAFT_196732 [Bipolaris maydis]KAJ5064817.1 hypothetical protein J3E74DRAFT_287419 [Bipolaris maydis]
MGAELSMVVTTEAAKAIAGKVFAADQVMKDIGVSTKFIAKAVDTMANLAYQEKFPDHVIHMFEDEVRNTSKCDPAGQHYFAVYHPGSESFAAIQNRLQGRMEFIGCFNDLNELGMSLLYTRQSVGSNAVLHVLLPSAHKYRIDETIHVPPAILPLRISGQTHSDGNPYVYAKLEVTGDFQCRGLGIILRDRERLAAYSAGAVAGASAGSAVAFVSGALLFTPVAPLALVGVLATPFAAYFTGKACKEDVKSDIRMKKKVGKDWLE